MGLPSESVTVPRMPLQVSSAMADGMQVKMRRSDPIAQERSLSGSVCCVLADWEPALRPVSQTAGGITGSSKLFDAVEGPSMDG
jgi:hypothetical protein